ncbi:hypothetical protein HJFPF1_05143 [Paramyrothecium foliicola]|nr:hypothetical protein HJFPF1_05143 [Paramyrothecium foliicola]
MSFAKDEPATVSVGEVTAMSDAELTQFMQKHRLPNGDYDLPVDGWERLSEPERSRLAERLEAQKRGPAQSPAATSRPLDLDDLDARLRQVSRSKSFSLRPESDSINRSRSPTPPIDRTRHETEAYHELVNDGGRPPYPIKLIEDVFEAPYNYAEMLKPWQESLTQIRAESIFQTQLQRWQDFRKWQSDHRGREDDDGGFSTYVERMKRYIQQYHQPRYAVKRLAEIEADPSCLQSSWDIRLSLRERQRRLCRERGCRSFRDYAEAVKRRLARHDFNQPFELDQDPKKQDKLTTWIEYLNYEYWWLDTYTREIERLEPEHDKLWQELVGKNVLKAHDTKDFVRTDESAMERETEKAQTWKAVEKAEDEGTRIYHLTQKDPRRLRIPRPKRISMMRHAAEKIFAAKRRSAEARRRSFLVVQFVRATFGYDDARRAAARHRILVQWVLDQVPLVASEVNPFKANRPGSDGRRTTKRRRTADVEPLETERPKRARLNLEGPSPVSKRTPPKATVMSPGLGMPMDREAIQDLQSKNPAARSLPEGPRRSARISAYRNASMKAF